MIVVLASRYDQSAKALVARWADEGAALLTAKDLSMPGWRYSLGPGDLSAAVVDGHEVDTGQITGVVTTTPFLAESEVVDLVPSDRAYVVAEMTAFLLSWLTSLACPVLNRPTPMSLTGPFWRPEQWALAAAGVGLRVNPVSRHVVYGQWDGEYTCGMASVTIVGERCVGEVDDELLKQARVLADAADVDLLSVEFSSPDRDAFFVRANACPALLHRPEVADAVLDYLKPPGLGSDGKEATE